MKMYYLCTYRLLHDAFVSVPKNVPCCIIKTLIVKNDIEEKYRNKRGQKLPI